MKGRSSHNTKMSNVFHKSHRSLINDYYKHSSPITSTFSCLYAMMPYETFKRRSFGCLSYNLSSSDAENNLKTLLTSGAAFSLPKSTIRNIPCRYQNETSEHGTTPTRKMASIFLAELFLLTWEFQASRSQNPLWSAFPLNKRQRKKPPNSANLATVPSTTITLTHPIKTFLANKNGTDHPAMLPQDFWALFINSTPK